VTERETVTERIAEIVRKALEAGQTVEIDGLGTLHALATGYEFLPQTRPEVFIAYVAEDLAPARRLCEALRAGGCSPWLDKDKLLPGQNWPRAIESAIETSDFFIPCFSSNSVSKWGGFQAEIRYALDCARRVPLDEIFIVPLRLDACRVPRPIQRELQYIDMFPDWPAGVRRLLDTLEHEFKRRRSAIFLQYE